MAHETGKRISHGEEEAITSATIGLWQHQRRGGTVGSVLLYQVIELDIQRPIADLLLLLIYSTSKRHLVTHHASLQE